MTPDEDQASAPLTEEPIVPRRGREVARLTGAAVLAVAGVALVGRLLWASRDQSPASTPLDLSRPWDDVDSNEVLSPEIAGLMTRAGLSPGPGRLAPPLSFQGIDGVAGSIEQFRGKVVLSEGQQPGIDYVGPDASQCNNGIADLGLALAGLPTTSEIYCERLGLRLWAWEGEGLRPSRYRQSARTAARPPGMSHEGEREG